MSTYDIFKNMDKSYLINTLKDSIDELVLSQSLINNIISNDDFDSSTKSFLTFVFDIMTTAKQTEFQVAENNAEKLNQILIDSTNILSNYFSNNSLITYYDEVLKQVLTDISESLNKKLDIDKIRKTVIDLLTTLYKEIYEERKSQFEETLNKFKEEVSDALIAEMSSKTKLISDRVEEQVKNELDRNKTYISKEITESINLLLYKNVPAYLKTLNAVFSKNFTQYVEANLTAKTKQIEVIHKIRSAYDSIKTPLVYVAKFWKYVKTTPELEVGAHNKKQKQKLKEKLLQPFKNFKERIKKQFDERVHKLKKGFLKRTRFIRTPKRFMQMKLGKFQRMIKNHEPTKTLRKYGLIPFLIESAIKAIKKNNKKYILLGQMDFKPFRFLSVITNTVDEFIESISQHAATINNNLKIYFEQNVVETYNARKKFSIFRRKRKKETGEDGDKEESEQGILSYLLSIPLMIRRLKKLWKFLKGVGNMFKTLGSFIAKISARIFTRGAEVLGKLLVSIGKRMNWPKVLRLGEKMFEWGNTARRVARGVRAGEQGLKALDKARKAKNAAHAMQEIRKAEEALEAVKEAKRVAEATKDTKNAVKLAKQIKDLERGIEAAKAVKSTANAAKFLEKVAEHATDLSKYGDELLEVTDDIALVVAAKNGKVITSGGKYFVSKTDDVVKVVLKGAKTASYGGKILPWIDWGVDLGVGYLIANLDEEGMKVIFGKDEITAQQINAFAWANAVAGADLLNKENWTQGIGTALFAIADAASVVWKYTSAGATIGAAVGTPVGAVAGAGVLSAPGAGVGFLSGGFIGGCIGFATGLTVAMIGTPRIARTFDAAADFFNGNEKEEVQTGIKIENDLPPPNISEVPGLQAPIRREYPGPAAPKAPQSFNDNVAKNMLPFPNGELLGGLQASPVVDEYEKIQANAMAEAGQQVELARQVGIDAQVSPISKDLAKLKSETMAEAELQVRIAKQHGLNLDEAPALQELKNRAATIRQIEEMSKSPLTLKMLVEESDSQYTFGFVQNPENEPVAEDGTIEDLSKLRKYIFVIDKLFKDRPDFQLMPISENSKDSTYATRAAKYWETGVIKNNKTARVETPLQLAF